MLTGMTACSQSIVVCSKRSNWTSYTPLQSTLLVTHTAAVESVMEYSNMYIVSNGNTVYLLTGTGGPTPMVQECRPIVFPIMAVVDI